MSKTFWASRDKPSDGIVVLWKKQPKNDEKSAEMYGCKIYYDGPGTIGDMNPVESRLIGIDLRVGECKEFAIGEVDRNG